MIEHFRYNDIVLYAKGWYKHSSNMIDDLGYIFSKIYAWTPKTEQEVSTMMLHAIDVLYDELNIKFDSEHYGRFNNSFASFISETNRYMKLYDVSHDMAIIMWSLKIFSNLSNTEIKIDTPHYGKKEHFRLGRLFGEWPISQTYKEMNRIARNMFG